MQLFEQVLGSDALKPQRFRIGASGILADIEAILGGHAGQHPAPGTY
jgi:hypothetical protein